MKEVNEKHLGDTLKVVEVRVIDRVEANGGLDSVHERMGLFTDMLNRIDSIVCGDEQHCFDERIDLGEADELFGVICGELGKRLMPIGLEWPRLTDGAQLTEYDAPDDVFAVAIGLNGECYALLDCIPVFGDGCKLLAVAGERIDRPNPQVTNTPPDTQERIDDDATMLPRSYCRSLLEWGEAHIDATDDPSLYDAMISDLLRRQRELDGHKTWGDK